MALKVVKCLIADLKLDKNNLREHDEENVTMIKMSIVTFGQYKPLIVDKDTMVVKIGNGRLQAMQELKWTACDCILMDFKDKQGMDVIDNRLNEMSEWHDKEVNEWLLNEKGIDWWGIDSDLSKDLMKIKNKEEKKAKKPESTSATVKVKFCPCCSKPLKKKNLMVMT